MMALPSPLSSSALFGTAATPWLGAGVPVFPCAPASKKPLVTSWGNLPAFEALDAIWRKHPTAMAGLACGPAGVVVIDCDNKNGIDGEAHLHTLCAALGVNLDTVPIVRTPSGGAHFYFAAPPGRNIGNSTKTLAPGVDVRAAGGFVIVPGSVRDDSARYAMRRPADLSTFISLVAGKQLPALPPALADRMHKGSNVIPLGRAGAIVATVGDDLSAGVKLPWSVERAAVEVANAPEGTRNGLLNRHAFTLGLKLASGALQDAEAGNKLADAARAAGLEDEEIERTISSAIQRASAQPSLQANSGQGDLWERTARGMPKATYNNAKLALSHLGIIAKRDVFADAVHIGNAPGTTTLANDHAGKLSPGALIFLRDEIQRRLGFDPSKDHVLSALEGSAERNRFNPVAEWLDSLTWDRTRRLLKWLPVVTGANAIELNEHIGLRLLMAMVARAKFPGTKFDLCVVLEGVQGCGKSTLARLLTSGVGDGYFTDAPGLIKQSSKERGELLAGKWVVELAELAGLRKSENEDVKAFLSQQIDRYRIPYQPIASDHPRSCVFIATTNELAYLNDGTGNRRFLPVRCGKIDLFAFTKMRNQLFAEANIYLQRRVNTARARGILVIDGKPLPEEIARDLALPQRLWAAAEAETEARRVPDPVDDVLPDIVTQLENNAATLPDGRRFIKTADLLALLHARIGRRIASQSLPHPMQLLGWKSHHPRLDETRRRGYYREQ